jgi:hypothetical protein
MSRSLTVVWIVFCLIGFLWVPSTWAEPEATKTENTITEGGLGLASLLATIPYGIAKIGYAAVGAIAGGLTYLEGKKESAEEIWDSALEGTYILTPDHLRGKKPIQFLGQSRPASPASGAVEERADRSAVGQ